jgi:hypothetical protein
VIVWNITTGEKVQELKPTPRSGRALQFDASGPTLAVSWRERNYRDARTTLLDWQTGVEEVSFDNAWNAHFLPGGESLMVLQSVAKGLFGWNRWNRAKKSFVYHGGHRWQTDFLSGMQISPNGAIVAACERTGGQSIHPSLRPLFNRLGLGGYAEIPVKDEIVLMDFKHGQLIGRIPAPEDLVFHADGKTALASSQGEIQVWDIPPRKSLPWFAVGAAFLALPIALLARRRVRRLRGA